MPTEFQDITPTDAEQPDSVNPKPLELARQFHQSYERLAPTFGYETRTETRAFDPNSPNGLLMTAVCADILGQMFPETGRPPLPDPEAKPGFYFADMLWISITLLVREKYDDPEQKDTIEMHQMMASTNKPDMDNMLEKLGDGFAQMTKLAGVDPEEYIYSIVKDKLGESMMAHFAKTLPPNKEVIGFEATAHSDLIIVPREPKPATAVMDGQTGEFTQGSAEELFGGR